MAQPDGGNDEGWGWEALGSEDDAPPDGAISIPSNDINQQSNVSGKESRESQSTEKAEATKSASEKSLLSSKKVQSATALSGITSSPSFQELEKAIGATLALHSSENEEGKVLSPSNSFTSSKLSRTNLTQQKLMQQRLRQQQYNNNYNARSISAANAKYGAYSQGHPTARSELSSFLHESDSRAIILFHTPQISQNIVRECCSKFGVLYYIRPEFHSKGVTLLSYFDLQAAVNAKQSISGMLGPEAEPSVHYSVMLHATTNNTEEYKLIVKNLPENTSESDVQSIFSRYGQLRVVYKSFGSGIDLSNNSASLPTSYSVEYFNIQDARLAASELSATSTSIWNAETVVKFAPLDERKQQLCKQLLSTLSRWRSEMASNNFSNHSQPNGMIPYGANLNMTSMISPVVPSLPPFLMNGHNFSPPRMSSQFPHPIPQLVDLNFQNLPSFPQPLLVDQGIPLGHTSVANQSPTMQNNIISNNHSTTGRNNYYPTHYQPPAQVYNHSMFGASDKNFSYAEANGRGDLRNSNLPRVSQATNNYKSDDKPSYASSEATQFRPSNMNRSKPSPPSSQSRDNYIENEFMLDINRIYDGSERRTTIMVKNIPNKYNQQMLLDEVNLRHKGTYDFFYLPIDFKNRCNVGYCFINYLDPKYIPAFVEDFHGQRWRSFNSEKICAVTYARIQGKQAMISRFQNSSLLEKDDEYKPLLFFSSGPDIGKPEPFPVTSQKRHQPTDFQRYAGSGGDYHTTGNQELGSATTT